MSFKNSMQFIPLTSIDSATFIGSYQAINSTGVPYPLFAFKVINNSTVDVTGSIDGTTDHFFVPTRSAFVYDLQTNKAPQNDFCAMKQGTVIYVKNGAAGMGSVYFEGLYQAQGE
jgi:hypothetical protein